METVIVKESHCPHQLLREFITPCVHLVGNSNRRGQTVIVTDEVINFATIALTSFVYLLLGGDLLFTGVLTVIAEK